jgi:hypothetical protein
MTNGVPPPNMNLDVIVELIIDLLRQHKDNLRGTIHQEPYKGDFFEIFALAFNAGMFESSARDDYLSAERLTSIILSRDPDVVDSTHLNTTWSNFRTFWQEWSYAWVRANRLKRC